VPFGNGSLELLKLAPACRQKVVDRWGSGICFIADVTNLHSCFALFVDGIDRIFNYAITGIFGSAMGLNPKI